MAPARPTRPQDEDHGGGPETTRNMHPPQPPKRQGSAAVPRAEGPPRLLVVVRHDGKVASHVVTRHSAPILIGRRDDCRIWIQNSAVSRVHAMLGFHDQKGWTYWDLDSTNGTAQVVAARNGDAPLRGKLRGPTPLVAGTTLSIGSTVELEFRDAPEEHAGGTHPMDASPAAKVLAADIARAARFNDLVVLLGASGTGKTHTADQLHKRSGRSGAFVAVNCAGLPQDAVHLAALFHGAHKGAYSGQLQAIVGLFRQVHHGTLFLDEVESLPEAAQGLLLDALDGARTFRPLSSPAIEGPFDFRIVLATKQRLLETGLRRDLANRMVNGMVITVPPLASRMEDIPGFMDQFGKSVAQELDATASIQFEEKAYLWALQQQWEPGQLRALQAVVRGAVRQAKDEQGGATLLVTADHLARKRAAWELAMGQTGVVPHDAEHDTDEMMLPVRPEEALRPVRSTAKLTADDLTAALERNEGKLAPAARSLGIALNTLKAKLRRFGLRK